MKRHINSRFTLSHEHQFLLFEWLLLKWKKRRIDGIQMHSDKRNVRFCSLLIIPQECMKDNSGQEGANLLNGRSIVPTEPAPFQIWQQKTLWNYSISLLQSLITPRRIKSSQIQFDRKAPAVSVLIVIGNKLMGWMRHIWGHATLIWLPFYLRESWNRMYFHTRMHVWFLQSIWPWHNHNGVWFV